MALEDGGMPPEMWLRRMEVCLQRCGSGVLRYGSGSLRYDSRYVTLEGGGMGSGGCRYGSEGQTETIANKRGMSKKYTTFGHPL